MFKFFTIAGVLLVISAVSQRANMLVQASEAGAGLSNGGGRTGSLLGSVGGDELMGLGGNGKVEKVLGDSLASLVGGGKSIESPKPLEQDSEYSEKDLDIFNNPTGFFKIFLNPLEFVKALSAKYKLNHVKFIEALGKPLLYGLEAALTPFTTTIKIVEKVFVPDSCRQHFICTLGANLSFLKAHVPKFSSKFGEGSSLIKAFGDGLLGEACASRFACESGEPKLKKEFANLTQ